MEERRKVKEKESRKKIINCMEKKVENKGQNLGNRMNECRNETKMMKKKGQYKFWRRMKRN